MSEHYTPRHRRHAWSAIREMRVESKSPRHASDRLRDRLGATGFDVTQLMRETFTGNPYSRGGVR